MQPTPTRSPAAKRADLGAHLLHATDDLVPGYHGEHGAAPFVPRLVEVGVADAAEEDVQVDVLRAGRPPLELERGQRASGHSRPHSLGSAGRRVRVAVPAAGESCVCVTETPSVQVVVRVWQASSSAIRRATASFPASSAFQ